MDLPETGSRTDGPLSLDSELREQLGLGEHESLRVIHHAPRVLTLERTGEVGGSALPWDRDLVLTADVNSFPLADLLSMIHASGKSGFLLFVQGEDEKSVYLHRGEVVFATSNQRVDRIGEFLLRSGAISLEQLSEANERWKPSMRFGKVLVELGILTPRDLWNAVKTQVEEIVRSLFAFTAGVVHFWEGEVQPDNIVRLALPTRRLIEEGLKRRDELFKFLAVLEDPVTRLTVVEGMEGRLSSSERHFIDVMVRERQFPAVCRRVGVDPLSGARTIQLLQLVGAVRLEREEAGDEGSSANDQRRLDEERLRECVYDHIKLLAELSAPIVAVDGVTDFSARLTRVLEDAASRHQALLSGVCLAPGGTLDPDVILTKALRLPGDRLRRVSEGLGELVTYIEFELNNHPRIESAEAFLEAVEGLRAKIQR